MFENFRKWARPGSLEDFESRPVLVEVKTRILERINRDRLRHHLTPVKYDRLAAQVGEAHCREMLAHKYLSHWNRQGYKPYHRYSFAGGADSVHENCAASDATYVVHRSVGDVIESVLRSHDDMMAEVPPEDGHRRNILDARHTHVGIGLAFDHYGMRMSQEFVQRYVALNAPFPRTLRVTETLPLSGRVLRQDCELQSIAVFYEPHARPMTVPDLARTSSYGLPDEVAYEFPVCGPGRRYSDGSAGTIKVAAGGKFSCPIRFRHGAPGLYTVCVWLKDREGRSIPATHLTVRCTG